MYDASQQLRDVNTIYLVFKEYANTCTADLPEGQSHRQADPTPTPIRSLLAIREDTYTLATRDTRGYLYVRGWLQTDGCNEFLQIRAKAITLFHRC